MAIVDEKYKIAIALCLFALFTLGSEAFGEEEVAKCYEDNANPYLRFSTKTTYKTVIDELKTSVDKPKECKAEMIWALVRHGIRYIVGMDDYYSLYKIRDEIIHNYENNERVLLCKNDVENLRKWYLKMGKENENQMHDKGLDEMQFVASRFRMNFPEILKPPYVPGQYMMMVTNTTSGKTLQSGQSFMEGMFPENPLVTVYPPLEDDLLVQIYTPCINRKIKESSQNKNKLFHNSQEFISVLRYVKKKLGLSDLTAKQVDLMYNMCRYDKAWNFEQTSPWCAVFDEEELKVLEYGQDVNYHFKSGYGDEFNKALGCPLLRDMVKRFEDLDKGIEDTQPDALFYMAHSTTLYTLFTALGIFKDEIELNPFNYVQQAERMWRTSTLGPFGANLAAVFYKCDNDVNRIAIYNNEKLVFVKGCDGGFCSWPLFLDIFKEFINAKECSTDQLCHETQIWFYVTCSSIGVAVCFVLWRLKKCLARRTVMPDLIKRVLRPKDKFHMV